MDIQDKPKILLLLENSNSHSDSIKIRARAKTGGYTVYFDFYSKGNRSLKYLNKKLHLDGTPATLAADKEKLRIITAMRNQLQNDQLKSETGFSFHNSKDKDFIIYFESLANKKDNTWLNTLNYLQSFATGDKIIFSCLTRSYCSKFADYLQSNVNQNSAYTYFSKFKASLNEAVKNDIISKNPATGIVIKKEDTKREFLSLDEIRTLSITAKPNFDTCNAFLFSCFTGLRISDLRTLTFDQIKDEYLEFKQQKTGQNERIKLNQTALNIVKEQLKFCRGKNIFILNGLPSVEYHLKTWVAAAGITKHISFHCARHTFATMALTNDIDLYTVSKLLGHRDIKTTQIYAKLIDKKKDEAIDKLPEIDI